MTRPAIPKRFCGQHELLLLGTRGEMSPPAPEDRWPSVIAEQKTAHSAKPVAAYEMIERLRKNGRKLWSYSVGSRPHTVTVYERRDRPDGPLQIRTWDPTGGTKGRGGWVKRSLGHRDTELAKQTAADLHAARVRGEQPEEPEAVTLGRILDLYTRHRTPRKCEFGQKSDARSVEL